MTFEMFCLFFMGWASEEELLKTSRTAQKVEGKFFMAKIEPATIG